MKVRFNVVRGGMEGVGSERQVEMHADIFMTFSFGVKPFLGRAILKQMLFSCNNQNCQRLAKPAAT